MILAPWTDAENAQLRDLWSKGVTAGQAAKIMGRSRNAIIGRAHRMRLASRRDPSYKKPRATRKEPRVKLVRRVCAKPVDDGINAAKKRFEIAPCQPPFMVGIMDISDAKCRFPIGHPKGPGFGFCGHPTISDSPYCAGHHALCYLPPQERRRAA